MEYKFVFASLVFISFIIWFEASSGVMLVSSSPDTIITTPDCNFTIDPTGIFCAFGWGSFLFGLGSLSSAYGLLNVILIAWGGTLFFIVVTKIIRGS